MSICKSKNGTVPGARKDKSSLLACHIRHICCIGTPRNSVKFKFGMKVIKFVIKFNIMVLYRSVSASRNSVKVKFGTKMKSLENYGKILGKLPKQLEDMQVPKRIFGCWHLPGKPPFPLHFVVYTIT